MATKKEQPVEFVTEDVTPYGVHKALNKALADAGLDKRVTPQMMYNYSRNELFKTTKDADGKIKVPKDDANRFIEKYVGKKTAARDEAEATPEDNEEVEAVSETS